MNNNVIVLVILVAGYYNIITLVRIYDINQNVREHFLFRSLSNSICIILCRYLSNSIIDIRLHNRLRFYFIRITTIRQCNFEHWICFIERRFVILFPNVLNKKNLNQT